MHLSQLPEDALILLLSYFPLQEQIRLRSVCSSWNCILRRLLSNVRSLKVFGPSRDADFYQTYVNRYNLFTEPDFTTLNLPSHSLVIYGGQPQANSALLGDLFPKLESLLVYTDSNRLRIDLPHLLATWGRTLLSLTLFQLECYLSKDQTPTFWTQLASLPSLRRLHLFELYRTVIPDYTVLHPVLRRLTDFTLADYRSGDPLPVLAQLGPGLVHLRLGPLISLSLEQLHKLISVNPGLALHLSSLSLSYIQPSRSTTAGSVVNARQLMHCFCTYFTRLTYLDIKFGSSVQLTDLLQDLTKLQHLTELKLDLGLSLDPQTIAQSGTSLPTVRHLHVDICELLSFTSLLDCLSLIFPNLEQLTFKCYTADLDYISQQVTPSLGGRHFAKLQVHNFVTINNHNI